MLTFIENYIIFSNCLSKGTRTTYNINTQGQTGDLNYPETFTVAFDSNWDGKKDNGGIKQNEFRICADCPSKCSVGGNYWGNDRCVDLFFFCILFFWSCRVAAATILFFFDSFFFFFDMIFFFS